MSKKIIKWITEAKLQEYQDRYEFIKSLPAHYEEKLELQKFINEIEDYNDFYEDAIIKELIENEYVICGDTHQYYAIPVFEEGYLILSMRKWGEVMSEVWKLRGFNTRPNFYLIALCSESVNEKLPVGCEI